MLIRNEKPEDYRKVEELIKRNFWNLYVPGCNEHYFIHQVRKSPNFIPELDFVLEENGEIIGQIIYHEEKLVSPDGNVKKVLSFGPFSIAKPYQRQGYGRKLLDYSIETAKTLGYDTIVIFGNPENYVPYGFKNCKRFNIYLAKDSYPVSLMVKELVDGVLEGKEWQYIDDVSYGFDETGFEEFDSTFEQMEKKYEKSQELFYIYSKSNVLR